MALETAVVATNAGGTRDVLRHGKDGLIVPCGDVEGFNQDGALKELGGLAELTIIDEQAGAEPAVLRRDLLEGFFEQADGHFVQRDAEEGDDGAVAERRQSQSLRLGCPAQRDQSSR